MKMDTKVAQEIIKEFGGFVVVSFEISGQGIGEPKYEFFPTTKESILATRKKFMLGNLVKSYNGGSLTLKGDNFEFWLNRACKIVGYKEEKIEEHIIQTPIYRCE